MDPATGSVGWGGAAKRERGGEMGAFHYSRRAGGRGQEGGGQGDGGAARGHTQEGTQASSVAACSDESSSFVGKAVANIQNFIRRDLHGSALARAVACVDISVVESDDMSPLVDVCLRGDTAAAYMDGDEVDELPDDGQETEPAPSALGQGVWAGFSVSKEFAGAEGRSVRGRALLERRVAELKKHRRGVLVVQRTAAGADRLAGLQLYASVEHKVSVFVVNDLHGFANLVKRLCDVNAGSCASRRKLCAGPVKRPCTDKVVRSIIAQLPGVKKADVASRMLAQCRTLGGVLQASEADLIKVVGVSRPQAHRLSRFFRCRRGHDNYACENSSFAIAKAEAARFP